MLRLAAGDADNAVRRRLPAAELTQGRPEVAAVLGVLVEARLLTADDGSVEVAHEALLREWPRMRDWLEQERESRRLEAHVRAAAAEWDDGGRDPADLYRGPRLSAVLDWQVGRESELAPVEREFVAASREVGERELLEQRRRNRRLRALAGGIFVLLVLALIAGGAALIQRSTARREARVALARPARRRGADRAAPRSGDVAGAGGGEPQLVACRPRARCMATRAPCADCALDLLVADHGSATTLERQPRRPDPCGR